MSNKSDVSVTPKVEDKSLQEQKPRALSKSEILPEEAFSRIADAPLIAGNYVRLLRDAEENYPAWLEAIRRAEKYIHFESYIIHEDAQGELFADELIKKAKDGVKVRLLYDWMGGFGKTSKKFWNRLRENGVEVRCYNPFSFVRPLGWINRDHRKTLIIDGETAFVTGLCVGQMWVGDEEKGEEPWRDTGIELRGKCVADVGKAFADLWSELGEPLPKDEIARKRDLQNEGDVKLRVIATKPGNAKIYRIDQMLGALAQETLWLTDAYFAGTPSYIETLRAASQDGVDVRLLVPAATDIPVMSAISRSGYRGMLESGVRIYEWNGPMLHAKTAVIDGFWSRVGSTNLNLASWISNCEMDVLIEDKNFGRQMQEMYLADLENATEIILNEQKKARLTKKRAAQKSDGLSSSGSTAKFAPSVIAVGNALGSSMSKNKNRTLDRMEAKIILTSGLLLLIIGVIAVFFPRILAIPLGIIFIWLAISLFINSYQSFKKIKESEAKIARKKAGIEKA